jgi:hypothetical protein
LLLFWRERLLPLLGWGDAAAAPETAKAIEAAVLCNDCDNDCDDRSGDRPVLAAAAAAAALAGVVRAGVRWPMPSSS